MSTFICPDCGKETRRTGIHQVRCHECAVIRKNRHGKGKGRGTGARFGRNWKEPAPRTLAGLSIVEVDRLAKEKHTTYGQLVARWALENEKAPPGAGTPGGRG